MKIKTKISFKEYRTLIFGLAYKRPLMKVIVGVGVIMILWIVDYYFQFFLVPKPEIYQYITLFLIAVVQPVVIYWTISRNYKSSNHLGEELEINITENEIEIQGESFYTELNWKKIFKVEEESKHFLIYQNNLSAIIISKKNLSNEEMKELKTILERLPNVPLNLKE